MSVMKFTRNSIFTDTDLEAEIYFEKERTV